MSLHWPGARRHGDPRLGDLTWLCGLSNGDATPAQCRSARPSSALHACAAPSCFRGNRALHAAGLEGAGRESGEQCPPRPPGSLQISGFSSPRLVLLGKVLPGVSLWSSNLQSGRNSLSFIQRSSGHLCWGYRSGQPLPSWGCVSRIRTQARCTMLPAGAGQLRCGRQLSVSRWGCLLSLLFFLHH